MRPIIWSLIAFLNAGVRPRTPLARTIVLVLVVKLIGIFGMKVLMFPDRVAPPVGEIAMARAIGVSASPQQNGVHRP